MLERPPNRLNTPPVNPISRSGASAETYDQVIDAIPVPKNATARNRMMSGGLSTNWAPTMRTDSGNTCQNGGIFREALKLKPLRNSVSERNPETRTPANPARNGTEA